MLNLLLLSLLSATANASFVSKSPATVVCIGQAAYASGGLDRPAQDALATCLAAQRAGARTLVFTDLPDARALQQALNLAHDSTRAEVPLLVVYSGMGTTLQEEPGMVGTAQGAAQDLILPLDEALRLLSLGRSAPTTLVVDACVCPGEAERCDLPRPAAGLLLLRAPPGQLVPDDDALARLLQGGLATSNGAPLQIEALVAAMKREGMSPLLIAPKLHTGDPVAPVR